MTEQETLFLLSVAKRLYNKVEGDGTDAIKINEISRVLLILISNTLYGRDRK